MEELSRITHNEELEAYKNRLRVLIIGIYIALVLHLILRAARWVYYGGEF